MIELQNIELRRGPRLLLHEASLRLAPGEHVALIGANGSGKSSLLKLLLGELEADAGELRIPAQWRLAHMAQEVEADARPALEYVVQGDPELARLEAELEKCTDPARLATLHQSLDSIDGYTARSRAERLLSGLGFAAGDAARPVAEFSGGWRIRLNLAQALMCRSDLLLLDEPTNHLDLDACLWLETWLQQYPGTFILISHDRDFIDALCARVLHIDNGNLEDYRGNYSDFERQRGERLAQQASLRERQQRRVAEIEQFVARFRAKATKARQAQSRLKELQRMELIAPAHIDSPFSFQFFPAGRASDPLLTLDRAAVGYDSAPVLEQVSLAIHPGSRIALLGANGAGKSTLLRSLAGAQRLLEGERLEGTHLRIGYFTQHQLESLDSDASPVLHLQRLSPEAREQQMRNFLGGFNFHGDAAVEPIRDFSGGEKARLALALIVWQRPNLLLLDEPTNHLDLDMCHALTESLQRFDGAVILISHDRHLLRNSAEELLLVADGGVSAYEGDLDDYRRWLLGRSGQSGNASGAARPAENKKEQRQRAAASRRKLEPLKKRVRETEIELERLNAELTIIGGQLAQPSLYDEAQKEQLRELLEQQGELRNRVEDTEQHWLALQEQLETAKADSA